MKTFTSIFLLLSSTLAFACPNLTGHFQCFDEEDGYYKNVITQTGTGTNTTYTIETDNGTEVVKADDKWNTVIQSGQQMETKAQCVGNTLEMTMNFVDPNAGAVNAIVKISIDASNDLAGETTLTVGGITLPAQKSVCVRQ